MNRGFYLRPSFMVTIRQNICNKLIMGRYHWWCRCGSTRTKRRWMSILFLSLFTDISLFPYVWFYGFSSFLYWYFTQDIPAQVIQWRFRFCPFEEYEPVWNCVRKATYKVMANKNMTCLEKKFKSTF